ncbi:hypothetical protein COBT_003161 [Conglomerata obtusa]
MQGTTSTSSDFVHNYQNSNNANDQIQVSEQTPLPGQFLSNDNPIDISSQNNTKPHTFHTRGDKNLHAFNESHNEFTLFTNEQMEAINLALQKDLSLTEIHNTNRPYYEMIPMDTHPLPNEQNAENSTIQGLSEINTVQDDQSTPSVLSNLTERQIAAIEIALRARLNYSDFKQVVDKIQKNEFPGNIALNTSQNNRNEVIVENYSNMFNDEITQTGASQNFSVIGHQSNGFDADTESQGINELIDEIITEKQMDHLILGLEAEGVDDTFFSAEQNESHSFVVENQGNNDDLFTEDQINNFIFELETEGNNDAIIAEEQFINENFALENQEIDDILLVEDQNNDTNVNLQSQESKELICDNIFTEDQINDMCVALANQNINPEILIVNVNHNLNGREIVEDKELKDSILEVLLENYQITIDEIIHEAKTSKYCNISVLINFEEIKNIYIENLSFKPLVETEDFIVNNPIYMDENVLDVLFSNEFLKENSHINLRNFIQQNKTNFILVVHFIDTCLQKNKYNFVNLYNFFKKEANKIINYETDSNLIIECRDLIQFSTSKMNFQNFIYFTGLSFFKSYSFNCSNDDFPKDSQNMFIFISMNYAIETILNAKIQAPSNNFPFDDGKLKNTHKLCVFYDINIIQIELIRILLYVIIPIISKQTLQRIITYSVCETMILTSYFYLMLKSKNKNATTFSSDKINRRLFIGDFLFHDDIKFESLFETTFLCNQKKMVRSLYFGKDYNYDLMMRFQQKKRTMLSLLSLMDCSKELVTYIENNKKDLRKEQKISITEEYKQLNIEANNILVKYEKENFEISINPDDIYILNKFRQFIQKMNTIICDYITK